MNSSKPLLVLLCVLVILSGRHSWASAQEQSKAEGVQWRRTVNGWERADGWLVDVQVAGASGGEARGLAAGSQRAWITLHPAIFAALQLGLSCAALAIFKPKFVQPAAVERRRPHRGEPHHVRSPAVKVSQ